LLGGFGEGEEMVGKRKQKKKWMREVAVGFFGKNREK